MRAMVAAAIGVPPLVGQRLRRMACEDPGRALYTHLSFDREPLCVTREATWRRASALAAALGARNLRHKPVLLVYAAGPDFAPAFLGTLLAGAIAVPVPVPQFAAQFDRLGRIVADCGPGAILSTSDLHTKLLARFAPDSPLRSCPWLTTDTDFLDPMADLPPVAPSDLALLQYTSGSTSEPRGVALTHSNIAHNLDMLAEAFQASPGERIVSWLPHFHDMGLLSGILGPLGCGGEAILMSPQSFLHRPLRWLQAISDYRAQISGAPNFGYELCLRSAARGEVSGLDLGCWTSAFTGAEPIRIATLDAFADGFAAHGFTRSALTPCYGMAEATVLVTCKPAGTPPTTHRLSREAARSGSAEPANGADGLTLTGCGTPATGTQLRIVDPMQHVALPAGRIGEVWIAGPQVARGYWNRQGDHNPFGTALRGDPTGSLWLRSGDLGFVTDEGELVFVDRLKDIIIVNGENYACHDLEQTAAASHPLLTADACVAVSIAAEDRTHVAIVAELFPIALASAEQVVSAIRASLFSTYLISVHTIAFVRPRRLDRTTSGKLQRRLTAQRLSDGTLRSLACYGDPVPSIPPVVPTSD